MTEAEVLSSVDAFAMLGLVRTSMSVRPDRLLSTQVADEAVKSKPAQLQRHLVSDDPESRLQWEALTVAKDAIEDLERFADGDAAAKRLRRCLEKLRPLSPYWTASVYVAF